MLRTRSSMSENIADLAITPTAGPGKWVSRTLATRAASWTLSTSWISASPRPGPMADDLATAELNDIIDPRTGRSPERYLSVSVRHASATLADGLSTAFSFLSENEIAAVSRRIGGVSVILIRADGTTLRNLNGPSYPEARTARSR